MWLDTPERGPKSKKLQRLSRNNISDSLQEEENSHRQAISRAKPGANDRTEKAFPLIRNRCLSCRGNFLRKDASSVLEQSILIFSPVLASLVGLTDTVIPHLWYMLYFFIYLTK